MMFSASRCFELSTSMTLAYRQELRQAAIAHAIASSRNAATNFRFAWQIFFSIGTLCR